MLAPPNAVQRWGNGKVSSSAQHLIALTNLYAMPADYLLDDTQKRVSHHETEKSPVSAGGGRRDPEKGNMMTESLSDFNPEDYGVQQASDGWPWLVGDGNVTLHWVTEPTGSDHFVIGRGDSIMNVSRLRGLQAVIGKALRYRTALERIAEEHGDE